MLLKNGLEILPKKCEVFRTELQYMGNTIYIKDRRVCIKLLRSRLEGIQKLKQPTTVKGCKSFTGMVNFLSMFCPELQKLLKPIYYLTRKGRQLYGEKSNRQLLWEIKCRLIKPPVLCLPDSKRKVSLIFRHK